MNHKKNVLTIAGSDSSGGAGIQADLKTFEALNVYGASVITSITSQNTKGVNSVFDLPEEVVESQLNTVLADITFSAIKIGMLKKCSYINLVTNALKNLPTTFIVLDPVMVSSSGYQLLDEDARQALSQNLFPLVDLITPNIPEAANLLGKDQNWVSENLQEACKQLITKFSLKAVLLKGGHLEGAVCIDTLATTDTLASTNTLNAIEFQRFQHQKVASNNTHGTGCTLASAIAAYYAQSRSLKKAVMMAGEYLQKTINSARFQQVGSGNGPLNHSLYMSDINNSNE